MPWIYIGTGVSTCILFALAIYTLITLNVIAKPPYAPALTLTVTGYDWWWKVEYEDDDPTYSFVTANEIHIPVGVPVLVKLKSADVIHAFWVPMLAGKTQMIPGLTNQQWIEADAEGVYRGQCTQYCGSSMLTWVWRLLRKMRLNSGNGKMSSVEQPKRFPQSTLMQERNFFWINAPVVIQFGNRGRRRPCTRFDSFEITPPDCRRIINQYP